VLPDRFADHSKGLLPYLPVGHDVIGPVDIEIINLVSRYELINIDGAGRLDLDGLEVFVGDFDVAFPFADLVSFDDIVRRARPSRAAPAAARC
jgi:hypothetical protein